MTLTIGDGQNVTGSFVDDASTASAVGPDTQPQVRTRLGRFVKPVNRLIQTMSRQDVIPDSFSVKDVCKSVFRSEAS